MVAEHEGPWAALGNRLAAELYGCVVLRDGVEDVAGQRDPVRLARPAPGAAPGRLLGQEPPRGPWKTAIVFWGVGSEAPGWLVRCLSEFADRGRQPDADRVAAAQAGTRALHVLRRPRGARHRTARRRGARAPARARRGAAGARFVSCRLSCPRGIRRTPRRNRPDRPSMRRRPLRPSLHWRQPWPLQYQRQRGPRRLQSTSDAGVRLAGCSY